MKVCNNFKSYMYLIQNVVQQNTHLLISKTIVQKFPTDKKVNLFKCQQHGI